MKFGEDIFSPLGNEIFHKNWYKGKLPIGRDSKSFQAIIYHFIFISPKKSYQEKNLKKNSKSLINPVLTMNYILLGASLKKRVLLRTSVLLVGMILFLMNGIRMYLLTKSVENGLMNQERGMKQQRFARSMGRCYLLTISLNNII